MPERNAARHSTSSPRFAFGANWRSFSRHIGESRVEQARVSLSDRLGDITGHTFLDVGCGSGLFSLAAVELGAARVLSFDVDPESVATAVALKRGHRPDADAWTIEPGDILDRAYVDALGRFDLVYSWGVLHHTGDMARAWENAAGLVAPGGRLFLSIYNDQGLASRLWRVVKRVYQVVPRPLRPLYVVLIMAPRELGSAVASGPAAYLESWREYDRNRGMSRWHDLVDWVGGYPFEVATPAHVLEFFAARGLHREWMLTCGRGLGCNQFVLRRAGAGTDSRGR